MADIADLAEAREAKQSRSCASMRLRHLAEAREAKQRADAIEAVIHRRQEIPLVNSDGQRICRDCGELIPLARVSAAPHAVRCVSCQQAMESGR